MNQGAIEEVTAVYFDKMAVRESPRRLYRYNAGSGRFYYSDGSVGADGRARVRMYPSVTTILGATCPMSPYLLEWVADYGQRRAEQLRDERAAFGTLMHQVFAEVIIQGGWDLDSTADTVEMQRQLKGWSFDTSGWATELNEDIVGLVSFWQTTRCKALGMEIPLASDSMGYAGCIDLVVEMDVTRGVGPGRPRVVSREIALIDFKSNRQAFYEEGAIQTHAYKALWTEAFPELPIVSTFLYGAKAWDETSRDRYRLQETTDHPLATAFPGLLAQYRLRQQKPRASLSLKGKVSLTSSVEAAIVSEPVEIALANRLAKRAAGGTKK